MVALLTPKPKRNAEALTKGPTIRNETIFFFDTSQNEVRGNARGRGGWRFEGIRRAKHGHAQVNGHHSRCLLLCLMYSQLIFVHGAEEGTRVPQKDCE